MNTKHPKTSAESCVILFAMLSLVWLGACLQGCVGSISVQEGVDAQVPDGNGTDGETADGNTADDGDGSRDAGQDGYADSSDTGADPVDAGQDGADEGLDAWDGRADSAGDEGSAYGAEFFVSPSGDDTNPGTQQSPFATLERARDAVRQLKQSSGLPEGGVVVWLLEGIYQRQSTFELGADDSGEQDRPVVYRAWPGDVVRVLGAVQLQAQWFEPVEETSPVFERLDTGARGHVLQVDLAAHGIDDYGQLTERGFGDGGDAALELFFNTAPMQLGRWPDKDADEQPQTFDDDTIIIYGHPQPDVSGTYTKSGTSDGVNSYDRQGLVDGKQYHLYRYNWDYEGNNYTAWFITTNAGGYPGGSDPWWHRYNLQLGEFQPSNGAQGNPTTANPERINHGFVSIDSAIDDTHFTYLGTRPERWTQAEELWLHGYWKYMWADRHAKVQQLDTTSKTVTLTEKPGYGIKSGQPFYAYNLLEEISEPGEWYLDRTTGILYFWPPDEMDQAEIFVSMMDAAVVQLADTSWITLQGITFEMTRSVLVKIDGGSDNLLLGCTLRNAGTSGLTINGERNGVDHSELYDTGDDCVIISGGVRATLTPAANFVTNCHMHDFSRWDWTYTPAVMVGQGVGNLVAHNLIHSAPHSAILYGGNENLIEFNEIHDVCRFSSDAGAIYSGRDWGWRGNLIRYNYIHHIASWFEGYGVHGVYLDDCLSGIEVFGNIFYEISGNAILSGGGRDNIMENNIMVHVGKVLYADSRGISRINNIPGDSWNMLERLTWDGVHYQEEPWASRYPALAAIPNDWAIISDPNALWLYPQGCVFSRNLGWDYGEWIHEDNYGGTGTLDKFAEVQDNLGDQDPLFVDEANGDLSLQPGSPAFSIPDFVDIPFDQIGIQP